MVYPILFWWDCGNHGIPKKNPKEYVICCNDIDKWTHNHWDQWNMFVWVRESPNWWIVIYIWFIISEILDRSHCVDRGWWITAGCHKVAIDGIWTMGISGSWSYWGHMNCWDIPWKIGLKNMVGTSNLGSSNVTSRSTCREPLQWPLTYVCN